jgi:hypothetical protein
MKTLHRDLVRRLRVLAPTELGRAAGGQAASTSTSGTPAAGDDTVGDSTLRPIVVFDTGPNTP